MKMLITGAWHASPAQLDRVSAMGHEIILCPDERGALPCPADMVEGVIGNGLFLYHPIQTFTSLRYIQLTSAGLDRVPLDYTAAHGITVHAAVGVYSVPVAEHALWGVLSLYREGGVFYENQKAHRWEKRRSLCELNGKTVLILGCGSIGNACATRFGAMGCTVLGLDISPRADDRYEAISPPLALPALLPRADIVISALPLTEKTTHLLNRNTLSLMKRGAVLVNLSRGAIVDTQALTNALTPAPDGTRPLGGAVLDVFEQEPLPPDSPLWALPGVIITPHNSFEGEGNADRLAAVILNNLKTEAERSTTHE